LLINPRPLDESRTQGSTSEFHRLEIKYEESYIWEDAFMYFGHLAAPARWRSPNALIFVSIITVLVLAVYGAMFRVYRVNIAIDTPWYLSFSYNYCVRSIDTDVTFGDQFPTTGMGGTVAFGKLAALVQCAALAPFDWSLVAANLLSAAAVVLSMAAIFAFLIGEGFSRLDAVICCLGLAATEPFVAMANQSKYEYVTFLLAVCGLLLAARRHLFFAGFTAVLAIEVQPIGIMAPIYLVAFEFSRMVQARRSRLEFDRAVKVVLGGALGVAVYFVLHPHILALIAAVPNPNEWGKDGSFHFLYGYFFETRLYRHLPELAAFAACLVVHIWRRDYTRWPFPLMASFATFFIGFFMAHHNAFYAPFWYFPSFLLVFLTISVHSRAIVLPVLVLVLFGPQYAVAYVEGHKYARQDELQVARSAIASRGADLSRAHIFGDSMLWPVFKDLPFQWTPWVMYRAQSIPRSTIYLICGLDRPFFTFEHVCADELPAFGDMQLINQFSWASRTYLVYESRK
jgi:hypothetical protein